MKVDEVAARPMERREATTQERLWAGTRSLACARFARYSFLPLIRTRGRPDGAGFDLERRLEDLLEKFALIDRGGRPDAQTFAAVQQHDLIGKFRRPGRARA